MCKINILDATIYDSSVERFDKLGWLPTDDIVRVRKPFMLHKISHGHCPEYFRPGSDAVLHMSRIEC